MIYLYKRGEHPRACETQATAARLEAQGYTRITETEYLSIRRTLETRRLREMKTAIRAAMNARQF